MLLRSRGATCLEELDTSREDFLQRCRPETIHLQTAGSTIQSRVVVTHESRRLKECSPIESWAFLAQCASRARSQLRGQSLSTLGRYTFLTCALWTPRCDIQLQSHLRCNKHVAQLRHCDAGSWLVSARVRIPVWGKPRPLAVAPRGGE